MSVLIKGLHMPDENHGCPFVDAEYGYCLVDFGITGQGEYCERMKNCPMNELVECGNCKYKDEKSGLCTGRGWPMQLVADDGFCEKAARRDEDERSD